MNPRATVLHLTGAAGGGVDRHIRDLCQDPIAGHQSLILHCGQALHVLEAPGQRRFFPIRAGAFAPLDDPGLREWLARTGLSVIHLHALGRRERGVLQQLRQWRALPYFVTVHDLGYLREDAFSERWSDAPKAEPSWTAQIDETLRQARAVIAPSRFIATGLAQTFQGLEPVVVPNGIDLPVPDRATPVQPKADLRGQRVFAVLGALGRHKGSSFLRAVLDALEGRGIVCVLIGYSDARIVGGWEIPHRLLVHGVYQPEDVPALLHAYGVQLAYFPKALPESFSYALSEVWAAGVQAMVHDSGALGERVREGGGWVIPENHDPGQVAAIIESHLRRNNDAIAGVVESRAEILARVPRRGDMVQELDALYRRCGIPQGASDDAALPESALLESALAQNLDGFEFRKELLRLANDLEAAEARYQTLREEQAQWSAQERAAIAELRAWNERLASDLATMRESSQSEIAALAAAKAGADAYARRLEEELGASRQWSEKLQTDCDLLRAECDRNQAMRTALTAEVDRLMHSIEEQQASTLERQAMLEVYANSFLRLPRWLRKALLRREGRRAES